MLKNKIVLVTGGSRGIGQSCVLTLAKQGYSVAFTYNVDNKSAIEVESNVRSEGGIAKAFQMDIGSRMNVKNTLEAIQNHFSDKISILINNAAMAQKLSFENITDKDWEKMLKVNLQGPFICAQEVLPFMVEQNWGRILNITSIGGQWGGLNQVHYAASKAGLINLTKSLSKIYSKHGITVNAVSPGIVDTEMITKDMGIKDVNTLNSDIPIGRIASTQEISNVINFLCSNESSYITGQTININGGMYCG